MSQVLHSGGGEPLTGSMTGPLSSIEIPVRVADRAGGEANNVILQRSYRPLVLRELCPAPAREVPEHVYDPVGQVAVDGNGRPLVPDLKKDWTTIEGTHTDGDGGDNEMWEWEEVK